MITILDFNRLDYQADEFPREKAQFLGLNTSGEVVGAWISELTADKDYYIKNKLYNGTDTKAASFVIRPTESAEYYAEIIQAARAAGRSDIVKQLINNYTTFTNYEHK